MGRGGHSIQGRGEEDKRDFHGSYRVLWVIGHSDSTDRVLPIIQRSISVASVKIIGVCN